jgi:NADH dehydrogenase [ubiquinone] 1 alpha subcomplex assembly factor 5
MDHLKSMGENTSLKARRDIISRETLVGMASIYQELYGDNKGIPATFEIIYFLGWKPSPDQPKAKKRGSAQISMKKLAEDFNTDLHTIVDNENIEKK